MAEAPPLTYEQTTRVILSKLGNLEHPIVLIGGQAVNFWASYYRDRLPVLEAKVRSDSHGGSRWFESSIAHSSREQRVN